MQVQEENAYFCGDDLMGKGKYAQNLKKIIDDCKSYPKNNENKSFVIGIDAPWGSGKTYFVNMLKNYLQGNWVKPGLNSEEICVSTKKTGANLPGADDVFYTPVYYDAWENDFWDNAFEPLFDQIIQAEPIYDEVEKKDIQELGKSAAKIVALGIKGVFSKKIEDFLNSDVIDEIIEEVKESKDNVSSIKIKVP